MVTMTILKSKILQYQLEWQASMFIKKDHNDDDETSKSKTLMMVTVMRHNIKMGQWQVDDNDNYHESHCVWWSKTPFW